MLGVFSDQIMLCLLLSLQRLLRLLSQCQRRHTFDVIAVHVSREYNVVAGMLTRFACTQEIDAVLPAGVQTAPLAQWRRCRHPSPTGSEPVFCIPLLRHAAPMCPTRQENLTPA